MPVRTLAADDDPGLARGATLVVIAYTDDDAGRVTLEGVRAHTPPDVPVLSLASLGPDALAVAARRAGDADLLWIAAGVRVGPEYLTRLREAALSDSTVISASALAGPGEDGDAFDEQARAVAAASPRAYPRVSQLDPRCVLIRRAGLERAQLGGRDLPPTLVELSDRLLALGLQHVVADDVLVGAGTQPHEPTADVVDDEDERGVLHRARTIARAAREGLSITVDARALGATGLGGTQVYTVQLILALASSESARVRAVVPHDLAPFAAEAFAAAPDLELLPYTQAAEGTELTDVVHRPQQVFTPEDLALLRLLGERIVVTHQDLIAYRDPAYHASPDEWWSYRRVTRLALAAADRAVLFSEHALRDVVEEDLLERQRGDVVGIGADRPLPSPVPRPPEGLPADEPFLVCLGADYAHKNRPFAIALLDALGRRHGWTGRLVLAGARAPHGSSREEEEELLARLPDIAPRVHRLGRIDDAERAWLYRNCAAVVFPSTYEGFGLIPFEAAQAGVPCLFAPQASLPELAGASAATLVPWDAAASADAVVGLLADGPDRDALVARLRTAGDAARWDDVAERLLQTYDRALRSPQRASAPRAWQELERERYIVELAQDVEHHKRIAAEYQDAFHDLSRRVDVGLPLVDEGGMLSHAQQRGLMRIGARPALRRLLLGPVGMLGGSRGDSEREK